MNNRMSYNDVEQLKRQIKARLGNVANDVMNMANGVSRNMPYGGARMQSQSRQPQSGMGLQYGRGGQQGRQQPQGGPAPQAGYGRQQGLQQRAGLPNAASSNMAFSNTASQQMKSSMVPSMPMKSSMAPPADMKSSMAPSVPMKSPDMRPQPMAGGTYFDKYNCGHDYPKMSMQQHIKSELDTDKQRRAENLQYAVVMSEVLGEPVSRKRRRKRRAV